MQDRIKQVLRDRIAKTTGGATQLREMANVFDLIHGMDLQPRHLALQYLIGVDVLPLGRTMTIVGKKGSGKSVFAWYLSTIFARNSGFIGFVDAEDKTSWDQVAGVYRNLGMNFQDWFWRQHPRTQEEMFEHMTIFQQELSKVISDKKESTYGAPIMYFVDSINHLGAAERAEKRLENNEQGAVGFAHAHKANALTDYLQAYTPHAISSWPSTLVTINHEKDKMDENASKKSYGPKETYEPGGEHKEFMYSLNIAVSRCNGMAAHTNEVKKQGMLLKTKKSCFSEVGRQIGLVMETRQTQLETGEIALRVNFDWGRALVDILADGTCGWGDGKGVVPKSVLGGFLEINRESKESCSCKTLGIEKASPGEVGDAIIAECENNPEFYKQIQKALWILNKKKYNPSEWEPPSQEKMKIDDAREILPNALDNSEPAAKRSKRGTA